MVLFISILPPPVIIAVTVKIMRVNREGVHLYENPPLGSRRESSKYYKPYINYRIINSIIRCRSFQELSLLERKLRKQ